MFNSVSNASLTETVAKQIVSQIVLGRLRPGEMLPTEEQLCEQFSVSRSVVREAMRTVSGAGMTSSHQGRGTVVLHESLWNEFSPDILQARLDVGAAGDFFQDFIELRMILESQAAGLAAERAEPAQLDDMRTHLHTMENALSDVDAFIMADLAFHNAMIRATGNTMIIRLFDLLQPMLITARRQGHDRSENRPPLDRNSDAAEHRAVFERIDARDQAGARNAMAEHLRWVATRETPHPPPGDVNGPAPSPPSSTQ
jgi:GntR family transcriptional repressor for pyruvate dehydrogenase complex